MALSMYKRVPDREKLQARAALLAAADEQSDTEIARLCGISRRTLMRWKRQPAMQQEIDAHRRRIQRHSEVRMIAERQQRTAHMDIQWQELQGKIETRANSPEMRGVPGGDTGLLRRRKVPFSGRHGGKEVYNYQLDTGLLRGMLRLEEAAAKALGQWGKPKYQPTALPRSPAVLSGKQQQAAMLIADGTRSDLEIAATCRIHRRTLARWKEQSSFRTRVAELRSTVFR
jgi:Homeodomain-like domain